MIDPNKGRYQKHFKHEWLMAELILKEFCGELKWSDADYEAFRFRCDGVSLIFYPHKTSGTGNISCRVRDAGSKDAVKLRDVLALLRIGAGFCNTFSRKLHDDWEYTSRLANRLRLQYGWANESAREQMHPKKRKKEPPK